MIRFERLNADAILPQRAHEGDAAFDIFATESRRLGTGVPRLFKTGLKMSMPQGYVALVLPRSGLALEHGVTVLNAPGLADPNFRGELGVILINHAHAPYTVRPGDRIAQLLVVKYMESNCMEALTSAAPDGRGEGGFGSTGR